MALVRVLSTLFQNSIEAAENADVKLRVEVAVTDDKLSLIVSDNGPGIPLDLADRIFQPFVSSKESGHGLGLALACRVISFLNGTIELLNPGAACAVFRITVPTERCQADGQGDDQGDGQHGV